MLPSRPNQALCFLGILAILVHVKATRIVEDVNKNAPDATALEPIAESFREALGPLNANEPVNANRNGRRQINWDAAADSISSPNEFPGNFFNFNVAPRARGIEFSPVGETTSFLVSATEASGQPVNFGITNFAAFSPERIFAPFGGTTFDVKFFDPADPDEPATSRGLGVVFTDVNATSLTKMVFYDVNDSILDEREVAAGGSRSFSFTGLIFNEAVVAKVRITSGNVPVQPNNGEIAVVLSEGFDIVAMDDFIFGEPTPIKSCGFVCKLIGFVGDVVDFICIF